MSEMLMLDYPGRPRRWMGDSYLDTVNTWHVPSIYRTIIYTKLLNFFCAKLVCIEPILMNPLSKNAQFNERD